MSIDCSRNIDIQKELSSRKHAAFFQHKETMIVEHNVVNIFLNNIEFKDERVVFHSSIRNDPPDYYIETNKRKIGVEIVELVNQEAATISSRISKDSKKNNLDNVIKNIISYKQVNYEYKFNYVKELKKEIDRKNLKCKDIFSLYQSVILLIHTDEDCVDLNIIQNQFYFSNNFEEIYLLKSPNSVIKLKGKIKYRAYI